MKVNAAGVILSLGMLCAGAVSTTAQDFRGRINGTVSDNTGAVLPGVTVTVSSPALIQPQVQVTSAAGDFRFLALPPGLYTVDFELTGFQSVKREGIRVVIDRGSWQPAPVFAWLQRLGEIDDEEMQRVFNMGLGLVLIVSPHYAESIRHQLADCGLESWTIGRATSGPRGVVWSDAT